MVKVTDAITSINRHLLVDTEKGRIPLMAKQAKNIAKRSIFIVNRPFQVKYSLLFALGGILVAMLFCAHIFYFLNEYLQVVIPDYADRPQVYAFVMSEKRKLILYLLLLVSLLGCFLFFMGIVFTHKIAGPIMVVKRRMAAIERGDFGAQIKLRKGDEFKDLAESFNNMLNSLVYLFRKK